MIMRKNEALEAEEKYKSNVEKTAEYVEFFDILETITNVGNDEVFTPRKVVDRMLDSLPEEVWHNPDYKWLNPATKTGKEDYEMFAGIEDDNELSNKFLEQQKKRAEELCPDEYPINSTSTRSTTTRSSEGTKRA